jgi:hypothetical protein
MPIGRRLLILTFPVVLVATAPGGLKAQDAERDSVARAKVDSLEAKIRELEARLDSLLAALARGEGSDSAAKSAGAELEALRAAARKAGGEQEQDTTEASRTRNLSILNPEISVTGDVLGQYLSPAGEQGYFTFVPREFEFAFEAALDPYTRTKIFLSYEEEFAIAPVGGGGRRGGPLGVRSRRGVRLLGRPAGPAGSESRTFPAADWAL